MTVLVVVSPEAELQIRAIDTWWREHRPVAPELFVDELSEAISMLEAVPGAGSSVDHPTVKGLRRMLLRAARVHVYYVADDTTVLVLAAWSAVRGAGPDLSRLLH